MAIALSIGTLILLFEAFGYDVNRKTGEVIQNGMVFVDAHPEQAQVYVNGRREGETDTRLVLQAGSYKVELKRDQYRDWTRSFDLEGGVIERLGYAFLFPRQLETKDVQLYGNMPQFATQSPDRKWVVIMQPGSQTNFDVIDLSNRNTPVTSLAIPNTLFTQTGGNHTFEMAEWSNDNRHVIIKHTYSGGFEFVLLDRETGANSLNLNKHFGVPLTGVSMRDKEFDQLYLYDTNGGVLRFGEVKSKALTLIASRVLAYKSYDSDILLYVTDEAAPEGKVIANIRRGNNTYKIRELPKSAKYFVDLARYDDQWYTAMGADVEQKVYVYEDVFEDIARESPRVPTPVAVLKVATPEYLSISANTRFIGLQGGSEFAVYDAEHNRTYRYDTQIKLDPGYKATWMDGHRYAVVSEGKLTVFDYDGINKQTLNNAHPQFLPFFDRDYDILYTLAPSAQVTTRTALTSTNMRIPSDQ